MLKTFIKYIKSTWRNWLAIAALSMYSYVLLTYKLFSLTPRLDSEIGDNTNLRIIFSAIGFATVIAFYLLISKWHTARVAFLTSAVFASSSIFLSTSRFADWHVVYFLVIPLLLIIGSWLRKKSDIDKLPLGAFITMSLLIIPGIWPFIVVGIAALRKRLVKAWQLSSSTAKYLTVAGSVLPVSVLVFAFIKWPSYISTWVGVSSLSQLSPSHLLANFTDIFDGLFWNGIDDQSRWLVGTPILDVFLTVMLILGIYYYLFGHHPLRKRVLGAFLAISISLITFSDQVPIELILPLLFILVGGGIALMLQQWFTIFPKNPIARSVGLILIIAAMAGSTFYQTKRYFIVWPETPATVRVWEEDS